MVKALWTRALGPGGFDDRRGSGRDGQHQGRAASCLQALGVFAHGVLRNKIVKAVVRILGGKVPDPALRERTPEFPRISARGPGMTRTTDIQDAASQRPGRPESRGRGRGHRGDPLPGLGHATLIPSDHQERLALMALKGRGLHRLERGAGVRAACSKSEWKQGMVAVAAVDYMRLMAKIPGCPRCSPASLLGPRTCEMQREALVKSLSLR